MSEPQGAGERLELWLKREKKKKKILEVSEVQYFIKLIIIPRV